MRSEVKRLYGVIHGIKNSIPSFIDGGVAVIPSRELVQDLETLLSGTKVGVEAFPPEEFHGGYIEQGGVKVWVPGEYYFERILYICDQQKLGVVYLDSFALFKQVVILKESADHLRRFSRLEDESGSLVSRRQKIREARNFDIRADYIGLIERDNYIVSVLARNPVDVAIIGQSHGDAIVMDTERLKTEGLSIGDYIRETVGTPFNGLVRATVTDSIPSRDDLKRRRRVKRLYELLTATEAPKEAN